MMPWELWVSQPTMWRPTLDFKAPSHSQDMNEMVYVVAKYIGLRIVNKA